MNAHEWQQECAYISRLTDARGNVPEMNHSAATAVQYMMMQRDAAKREGFPGVALVIAECLKDMDCEWRKFAAVVQEERDTTADPVRRVNLARLLGSVRKLTP